MQRIFIEKMAEYVGKSVTVAGWIETKRNHGKVIFLDIKDSTGKVQSVVVSSQSFFDQAVQVKEQSAVIVSGKIVKRPERMITAGFNGDIELQISDLIIKNEAKDFNSLPHSLF